MSRSKSSTPESKKECLEHLCAELGEDVIRQLHEAYKLTAAALYRRAKERADLQLGKTAPVAHQGKKRP